MDIRRGKINSLCVCGVDVTCFHALCCGPFTTSLVREDATMLE